jgi:hypothetical protein
MEKRMAEKNKESKQISIKEIEKKNRDEALAKSTLTTTNKGFNLMLKMGYKHGETLGAHSSKEINENDKRPTKHGLLEPISVEIKTNREGLGKKQKLNDIKKVIENKEENQKIASQMYLNNKRQQFLFNKLRRNLKKFQKLCYELDTNKGVTKPIYIY